MAWRRHERRQPSAGTTPYAIPMDTRPERKPDDELLVE
jgi:hypothetical protein